MAEKKSSRSHPQEVVSRFWNKFHHKSPGKVTSIFPRELYKDLDPDFVPSSATRVRNAAQSYQIARTKCIDMVEAAVAHCESTNSRFCDPDFDIESDFFWKDDNCLLGLARCNCAEENKKPNENGDSPGDENDGSGAGYSRCNGMPARSMGVSACASKVRPQSVHPIPWIFDSPQFTVGGFSGSDIKQGILGDCWWLVGVGNIAHRKDLMEKICVARDEECGVYGFVFFKDGEWIPTIVDDSLYLHTEDFGATYEEHDSNGKKAKKWKQNYQTGSEALFCAKCVDENETWLPLLEKAVSGYQDETQKARFA
jgi:hypothetical protein